MTDSRTPGSNTLFAISAFNHALSQNADASELAEWQQIIARAKSVEDDPDPTNVSAIENQITIAEQRSRPPAPEAVLTSLRQKLARARARESGTALDAMLLHKQRNAILQNQRGSIMSGVMRRQLELLDVQEKAAAENQLVFERRVANGAVRAYQRWQEAIKNDDSPYVIKGLEQIYLDNAREPLDATFLTRVAEDALRMGKTDRVRDLFGPQAARAVRTEIERASLPTDSATLEGQLADRTSRGAPPVLLDALRTRLSAQKARETSLAGTITPNLPPPTPVIPSQARIPRGAEPPVSPPGADQEAPLVLANEPAPIAPAPPSFARQAVTAAAILAVPAALVTLAVRGVGGGR